MLSQTAARSATGLLQRLKEMLILKLFAHSAHSCLEHTKCYSVTYVQHLKSVSGHCTLKLGESLYSCLKKHCAAQYSTVLRAILKESPRLAGEEDKYNDSTTHYIERRKNNVATVYSLAEETSKREDENERAHTKGGGGK